MSLKKNLLNNGLASALQKLSKVVEQLIMVPFFLSSWGVAFYGEWLTLTIVPTILDFCDFGFGSAAANTFVLKYAAGDEEEAANVKKSAFFIITLAIISSVVIGSVMLLVLNYFHVFEKSLIPKHDAILAVSILMLARILNFYQQLFEAHYRSARRAALGVNLTSIYSFINFGVSTIVLIFKGGIIIFALANLIVSVIFNIFYALKANSILKLEHHGVIKRENIKEIVNKGFGYFLSPIWQAVFFQGTTFVVRIVLGPAAVAVFNTVRTVSRSANQAYSMVNNTMFPELQFEIGANRLDKAKKLFRVALSFVLAIAVAGVVILYLFGPWLYEKWTKGKLHPSPAMWNVFLIGIALNALWWTAGTMFRAVNKPYGLAIAGLISSIISVLASYILAKKFGLVGAAIGSLLLEVIMLLYVLPVSLKLLDQSYLTLISDMWKDIDSMIKFKRRTYPVK